MQQILNYPVDDVITLVTSVPTECAVRMSKSGLLYTFLSCQIWIDPSLAPPIIRSPMQWE